jgi:tetratricopeptide (TPR) repeat protein
MVRWAAVSAACAVVVGLGAVQLASSAAYGDLAARPSLPAMLHDVAPGLLRPLIGDAGAQVAAAIHNRDFAAAERLVATLPDGAGAADLRGRIAEARGAYGAALDDYVRARDVVRAERIIDAEAARDPVRAADDQKRLVEAVRDHGGAAEVTGEAWWRLGQLQAAAGYHDVARRILYWEDAEESYQHALSSAPNEETYLLAAGYQAVANGDPLLGQQYYKRAAEVVPNSADAWAGVAWAAAAIDDCVYARSALDRSRALRAASGVRARDPVDDPNLGSALQLCLP